MRALRWLLCVALAADRSGLCGPGAGKIRDWFNDRRSFGDQLEIPPEFFECALGACGIFPV